jgi:hypothetical protein
MSAKPMELYPVRATCARGLAAVLGDELEPGRSC